eukprot:3673444-Prorocentrum_lima.AAC.1
MSERGVHGELVGLGSEGRREAMKKFNLKGGKKGIEGRCRRATLLQTPTSENELRGGAILKVDLLVEEAKGVNERRLKTRPQQQ